MGHLFKGELRSFFIFLYSKVLRKTRWTKKNAPQKQFVFSSYGVFKFHWWRHWGQKTILPWKFLYNWLISGLIIVAYDQDGMLQISIFIHF